MDIEKLKLYQKRKVYETFKEKHKDKKKQVIIYTSLSSYLPFLFNISVNFVLNSISFQGYPLVTDRVCVCVSNIIHMHGRHGMA